MCWPFLVVEEILNCVLKVGDGVALCDGIGEISEPSVTSRTQHAAYLATEVAVVNGQPLRSSAFTMAYPVWVGTNCALKPLMIQHRIPEFCSGSSKQHAESRLRDSLSMRVVVGALSCGDLGTVFSAIRLLILGDGLLVFNIVVMVLLGAFHLVCNSVRFVSDRTLCFVGSVVRAVIRPLLCRSVHACISHGGSPC